MLSILDMLSAPVSKVRRKPRSNACAGWRIFSLKAFARLFITPLRQHG